MAGGPAKGGFSIAMLVHWSVNTVCDECPLFWGVVLNVLVMFWGGHIANPVQDRDKG